MVGVKEAGSAGLDIRVSKCLLTRIFVTCVFA